MRRFLKLMLKISLSIFSLGATITEPTKKNTKAVVVVSFGTTVQDARISDLGGIENAIKSAFPTHTFFNANTSYIVMKRNAQNGIQIKDLPTTLCELKKSGYKDVLVQPTHLLHGEEYEKKVLETVNKFQKDFTRLVVGKPLISKKEDYALTASAVATQFPLLQKNEGIVLMGHGSPRNNNQSFGNTYNNLQAAFDAMRLPVIVGTVEEFDSPNIFSVLKILADRGYKQVHMYPLMLVAGDHAINDMYGDNADSWKNKIEKTGVKTIGHMVGLGRNTAIQGLYVTHALTASTDA
ncbi:MAG: sirohydrochlorin cobaltochelatase [Acidaminococcaceae bacterium]|nr:sirohydrochlorin cobaltochelatase [Acidaminococcaceae bacterium]